MIDPIFHMFKIKHATLDRLKVLDPNMDGVHIYINLESVFNKLINPRVNNYLMASIRGEDDKSKLKLTLVSHVINLAQHYRLYCAKHKKESRIILYWNYPISTNYTNRKYIKTKKKKGIGGKIVNAILSLFMFFGNKMEVLFLAQLVMQALTFVLLAVIGKTMQKGIWGWIPALLYAVAPTCFYTASDAGITNFWTLIVTLGLFVICMFEKAWKKKNITYLVMVFTQLLFGGFVFYNKMGVLLYNKAPFVSGGEMPGLQGVLYIETLVGVAFLLVYCVTFFMDKQDHRSLFILPVLVYSILFVWLSVYEYEAFYCMMLLALINLYFMISQSMRTIFRGKPEVVTGKNMTLENAETELNRILASSKAKGVSLERVIALAKNIYEKGESND